MGVREIPHEPTTGSKPSEPLVNGQLVDDPIGEAVQRDANAERHKEPEARQ
jgi:hypothetical protein